VTATGVLLMAYGGPGSLEDIPAYLLDVRGGRETPPSLIEEISERYRLIGGRSPLLDITQRAAGALSRQIDLPVYVGMRHWHPYIAETVSQMTSDGIGRVIGVCMAPHYSAMSIGAYRKRLEEALAAQDHVVELCFVESWGARPAFIDALTSNVLRAMLRFDDATRPGIKVVFTAHSLPKSILDHGDPYVEQLAETAHLLAARLALPDDRWMFSFQSAAQTGSPWLGPAIEDVIPELAAQGERNVVIAPVGFIADHVEVLYDLDIEAQRIAGEARIRVERIPMLNDSPALIDTLAGIVRDQLAAAEVEP